jgi:2Fe-2S ferredoxin
MGKIIFHPYEIALPVQINKSILNIALENNIDIEHYCGGMSACHTCRINIIKGMEAFNEKNEDENYQLEFIGKNDDNARLSCCAIITRVPESDIEILIPGNTTLNNEDLLL